MKIFKKLLITTLLLAFYACNNESKKQSQIANTMLMSHCIHKLTDVIVVDVFSPPVASRIYSYATLAAYETARLSQKNTQSIASKLNDFTPMPALEKGKTYDFGVASLRAFSKTAQKLTFSSFEIEDFEAELMPNMKENLSETIFNNSIALGDSVAATVLKRAAKDNYKETRGMERYAVTQKKGDWIPTSPDYADAIEPNWMKMKTFFLENPAQFRPQAPTPYSEIKGSAFDKLVQEVINISKRRSPEQTTMARFWDDNALVTKHKGHAMFADKKMTPGGHWINIAAMMCVQKDLDLVKTTETLALTSLAIYDSFLSCWEAKYATQRVRPQTVIQNTVDEKWVSFLQTPPFPEYTSGHSTISAAAAEILTANIGDNVAYEDTTEVRFGLFKRKFKSFRQAAQESSISRVYGGIHFSDATTAGSLQGQKIGKYLLKKIKK